MYAQDIKGRHIIIKKLKNDEEYKVVSLLRDQPSLLDSSSFPSVIPILNILQHDGHRFAVMPRCVNLLDSIYFVNDKSDGGIIYST